MQSERKKARTDAERRRAAADLIAAISFARAGGFTWETIGRAMGMSHQGARRFYYKHWGVDVER